MKIAAVLIFLLLNSFTAIAQDYLHNLNDTLPNITFTSINSNKYNTHELRGKIIVLNFWYTHCPPCVAELPDLQALEKKYKDKGVVLLCLSKDADTQTKNFITKRGLSLDAIANTQDTHTLFQIPFYPTTVIVDKHGVIRKSCPTVPCVDRFIIELLEEK